MEKEHERVESVKRHATAHHTIHLTPRMHGIVIYRYNYSLYTGRNTCTQGAHAIVSVGICQPWLRCSLITYSNHTHTHLLCLCSCCTFFCSFSVLGDVSPQCAVFVRVLLPLVFSFFVFRFSNIFSSLFVDFQILTSAQQTLPHLFYFS